MLFSLNILNILFEYVCALVIDTVLGLFLYVNKPCLSDHYFEHCYIIEKPYVSYKPIPLL